MATRTNCQTELADMLHARRREAEMDVHSRIRAGRGAHSPAGGDTLEHAEADVQGDLTLTLIQMRAATVVRIDEALERLAAGTYGYCARCGSAISVARLRALPFASRCQSCEAQREADGRQAHMAGLRRDGLPLFHDGTGM